MSIEVQTQLRLPVEFRKRLGSLKSRREVYQLLRKAGLNTVCEEARCPNIGECFSNKTATFMILGDTCTRRCHFCSVATGRPQAIDPSEPQSLVNAVKSLGLDYVVLTSVDRDELADCGAGHWADCIRALRSQLMDATIELLTPDFKGKPELIDVVLAAKPHVFGHNIETVERIYRKVRPQSRFETTCSVLEYVAKNAFVTVKSGMMVGLGETDEEVCDTLKLLKDIGVEIVTIGQYLRPTKKHWPVVRYVGEESYKQWVAFGKNLGFKNVFAGPFVRSSYHAKETHIKALS